MPLTARTAETAAAAALVRAGLVDDLDAGVLIMSQNDRAGLLVAVTSLSVRVLLAANGYDVAKALAVIDQWIEAGAPP